MSSFKKFPPDDVSATAEFLTSWSVFEVNGLAVYVVPILTAAVFTQELQPADKKILQLALYFMLVVFHSRLSRSIVVRYLLGVGLGLALAFLSCALFVYKFFSSMLPPSARTAVSIVSVLAAVLVPSYAARERIVTEGLTTALTVLYNHSLHLILEIWKYQYQTGSYGALPLGKAFFAAFILVGVLMVHYLGLFEARVCAECGDNLADFDCPQCAEAWKAEVQSESGRRGPAPASHRYVCSSCHSMAERAEGAPHEDRVRVPRLGQRAVSLGFYVVACYALLGAEWPPKPRMAAALLGLSFVVEFDGLRWLALCLRVRERSPTARPLEFARNVDEYNARRDRTTQAELQKLRQAVSGNPLLASNLRDDVSKREMNRFLVQDNYSPYVDADADDRRRGMCPRLAPVFVLLVAAAVGTLYLDPPLMRPHVEQAKGALRRAAYAFTDALMDDPRDGPLPDEPARDGPAEAEPPRDAPPRDDAPGGGPPQDDPNREP